MRQHPGQLQTGNGLLGVARFEPATRGTFPGSVPRGAAAPRCWGPLSVSPRLALGGCPRSSPAAPLGAPAADSARRPGCRLFGPCPERVRPGASLALLRARLRPASPPVSTSVSQGQSPLSVTGTREGDLEVPRAHTLYRLGSPRPELGVCPSSW